MRAWVMGALLVLVACGPGTPRHPLGHENESLAPCPGTGNCAHTGQRYPSGTRGIFLSSAPSRRELLPMVREVVESMPGTTVVTEEPTYLHVEVRRGILGAVDDLELFVARDRELIVRSSARTARGGRGASVARVEELRQRLNEAGLIR